MTRVHFRWDRRPSQPATEALRRVVENTVRSLNGPEGEVHVLVTGDEELRGLNRQYRDLDTATDVLSFPDGDTLPDGGVLIGQIAISLDAVRRQATPEPRYLPGWAVLLLVLVLERSALTASDRARARLRARDLHSPRHPTARGRTRTRAGERVGESLGGWP